MQTENCGFSVEWGLHVSYDNRSFFILMIFLRLLHRPGFLNQYPDWGRLLQTFLLFWKYPFLYSTYFFNLSYAWGFKSQINLFQPCYKSSFLFRCFVTQPVLKDVKHSTHMIMFMCGTLLLCFQERVIDKLVHFFSSTLERLGDRAGEENDCCFNSAPYPSISFSFFFLVSSFTRLVSVRFYSWPPSGNNISSWKQAISNFKEELCVCARALRGDIKAFSVGFGLASPTKLCWCSENGPLLKFCCKAVAVYKAFDSNAKLVIKCWKVQLLGGITCQAGLWQNVWPWLRLKICINSVKACIVPQERRSGLC